MDGLLNVNKPTGMTSHDVVLFVRRHFGIKKVGHTGILDPMATGVLVLVLGRATKIASVLIDQDKEYDAVMCLGTSTHTHDREGRVLKEEAFEGVKTKNIRDVIASFVGEIEQIPPMVSARRYRGKRLYELARKGIHVDREPKKVHIHEIHINWINMPHVSFRLRCSKGTYVRTFCNDVGEKLGIGAHLHSLERTKSGPFLLKDSVSWTELQTLNKDQLERRIWPLSPTLYREIGTSKTGLCV